MYKVLSVKQSCFSRILEITVRAGDVFFTTTKRPFCNNTRQCGYTSFQPSGKSPSAVRTVTAGKSTVKYSPKPVYTQCYRDWHTARTPRKYLHEAGHPFLVSTGSVTNTGGSRGTPITRSFPTEAGESTATNTAAVL